jgi:hypothetical protein
MTPENNPATRSESAPHVGSAATDPNPPAMLDGLFAESPDWPQEIIVEPSRLSSGVFGDAEGDISKAYCADTFPKIQTFTHEGRPYISTGGTNDTAFCYPLLSGHRQIEAKPYSYEGKAVFLNRTPFTLGPKILFRSRERTVAEETDLMRREYAFGGHFVSGRTYRQLLEEWAEDSPSNLQTAIAQELAQDNLPATQDEMRARLTNAPAPVDCAEPESEQTQLPGF